MAKKLEQHTPKWEKLQKRYTRSLWHFCYEIMGFRDINDPFHKYELDLFDENRRAGIKSTLTLWPRGHLKSSCLTVGDSLRCICLNPNIRILILNATGENAEDFLSVIKSHITDNKKFHFFYPHVKRLVGDGAKWSASQAIVERKVILPEPTIRALGIDANIVSKHFDMIKFDDIVTWDNTDTPDKIRTLKKKYEYASGDVLEPGGIEDVVGTRYDFYDLYDMLLEDDDFVCSVRQLREMNTKTGREEYIFPQKFNAKVEARLKKKHTFFIFNCQYFNAPVKNEDMLFQKSMIRYWEQLPPNGVFRITVDPASSTENYADRSAIVCCYWVGPCEPYPHGAVFLYHYVYERMDTDTLLDEMFGMYAERQPEFLSIEIQGSQSGTLWDVVMKEKDRRNFVNMDILKFSPTQGNKKYSRISLMQPYFKRAQFYIKKEHEEFEQEMLKYTGFKKKEKDDLIDATAQQFQMGDFPVGVMEDEDDDDEYESLYGPNSATGY